MPGVSAWLRCSAETLVRSVVWDLPETAPPLHDSLRRLCHAHNRPVFRICLARLVRTGPVSRTGPYAGSCSAGMGSLLPLEESLRMSDAFLLCRGMSWSAIPLRCPPLRSAAHR